jgi:hypothetical protein
MKRSKKVQSWYVDLNTIESWSHLWTAKQAEKQLSGFEFKGPGWYLGHEECMLVLPAEKASQNPNLYMYRWKLIGPPKTVYRFIIWNGRSDTRDSFRELAQAPIRERACEVSKHAPDKSAS